jgi:hypothetical protein
MYDWQTTVMVDGEPKTLEWKEPDYDAGWFKYRANQAILTFENHRNHITRQTMITVLEGLFRHAYEKGRLDEKRENAKV